MCNNNISFTPSIIYFLYIAVGKSIISLHNYYTHANYAREENHDREVSKLCIGTVLFIEAEIVHMFRVHVRVHINFHAFEAFVYLCSHSLVSQRCVIKTWEGLGTRLVFWARNSLRTLRVEIESATLQDYSLI